MLQGARHAHVQALNSAANELNIPLQIFELRKDNDPVSYTHLRAHET